MDKKLKEAQDILKMYEQEHLLYFYDELNSEEKEDLLNQIIETDFKNMLKIYTKSFEDDSIDKRAISPIDYTCVRKLNSAQKRKYEAIGEKIIKNGEVAVFTLAGGQGTRLGYSGPKGCYEIEVPPRKSLFEFTCDKLKKVHADYGVHLKWYIMTSVFNDKETKAYFKERNYFGYPAEKIYFFQQDTLPIITKEGKVILDNTHTLKKGSNGNGDVFRAFYRAKLTSTLSDVKWISISGIDNILLEIVDPLFIGITAFNKSEIGSKSIPKKDLRDEDFVFANVFNRVNIIDPKNLTDEMLISKNENGLYNYNQINILSHLFTKKAFIQAFKIGIPYHRAFKKNDFIDEEGMKVVASEPNSFKFEKFIFDVFKYYKRFTLLEVREEEEFAPIKAFTGSATPETALEMYLKKKIRQENFKE